MGVRVLAAGMLTTLQDGGRHGMRHLGVGTAGAVDPWSHALANLLAGNPKDAATLEITLSGPLLRFDAPARIALCGARIDARVDEARGQSHAIPMARPVDLPAGSLLQLGACREGARSYLAVEGGFAVPAVLGSAATDLRGGFGGMRGRALANGDVLPLRMRRARDIGALHCASWWIDTASDDDPFPNIRVLPGVVATAPADALFATAWKVAAASDRQGLRLAGDALAATDARERISEPVFPGTVQLPPDGRPIVLLADAQTHGGYPRIAHAIRADWPKLAQLRPGDALAFRPCTAQEARAAYAAQRHRLARLGLAITAHR
jgi:antagonist of KipI